MDIFEKELPDYDDYHKLPDLLDRNRTDVLVPKDEDIELLFRPVEEEDPLSESIEEATHLDEKTKKRYIGQAKEYVSNLKENIMSDQFDLNSKYPTYSIDEWNEFLLDRIVSTYVTKHKRTLLKSRAEANLANPTSKNKRDSLQVLSTMDDDIVQKNNIVIIRIADKYAE